MMRAAIVLNLAAYCVVVSQPIFYMLALGEAQRALSAPAYVELRQRINALMNRRVPVVYVVALATSILALGTALAVRHAALTLATAVGLACLIADAYFMMRENLPLNGVMDAWTPESYPADWSVYRARWFAIFAYRQLILIFGFGILLVAAVCGAPY